MNAYQYDNYCHNHHDLGCGRDRRRGHASQGGDDSTIGHEMTEKNNMFWSVRDEGLRLLLFSFVVSLAVVSFFMMMNGAMHLL